MLPNPRVTRPRCVFFEQLLLGNDGVRGTRLLAEWEANDVEFGVGDEVILGISHGESFLHFLHCLDLLEFTPKEYNMRHYRTVYSIQLCNIGMHSITLYQIIPSANVEI